MEKVIKDIAYLLKALKRFNGKEFRHMDTRKLAKGKETAFNYLFYSGAMFKERLGIYRMNTKCKLTPTQIYHNSLDYIRQIKIGRGQDTVTISESKVKEAIKVLKSLGYRIQKPVVTSFKDV